MVVSKRVELITFDRLGCFVHEVPKCLICSEAFNCSRVQAILFDEPVHRGSRFQFLQNLRSCFQVASEEKCDKNFQRMQAQSFHFSNRIFSEGGEMSIMLRIFTVIWVRISGQIDILRMGFKSLYHSSNHCFKTF